MHALECGPRCTSWICNNWTAGLTAAFDKFLFIGGLQQAGKWVKKNRGHDVYTIHKYSSLAPILGHQWHLQVLNKQMDFCYINLETVQHHLHQRQDIQDAMDYGRSVHGGYILVFRLVVFMHQQ